jgi:hypothetical protein
LSAANTPGPRACASLRPQRGRISICDPSGIVARSCTRSGGAPLRDDPRLPYEIPPGSTASIPPGSICNAPNGILAPRSQRDPPPPPTATRSHTVAGGRA